VLRPIGAWVIFSFLITPKHPGDHLPLGEVKYSL